MIRAALNFHSHSKKVDGDFIFNIVFELHRGVGENGYSILHQDDILLSTSANPYAFLNPIQSRG